MDSQEDWWQGRIDRLGSSKCRHAAPQNEKPANSMLFFSSCDARPNSQLAASLTSKNDAGMARGLQFRHCFAVV